MKNKEKKKNVEQENQQYSQMDNKVTSQEEDYVNIYWDEWRDQGEDY